MALDRLAYVIEAVIYVHSFVPRLGYCSFHVVVTWHAFLKLIIIILIKGFPYCIDTMQRMRYIKSGGLVSTESKKEIEDVLDSTYSK